ncbi:methyltransferase family protein [Pendulispora albinea]|uniref:Isoprenylcysteine carboxylmethyltransferase family protein n=1 Tax=Pendulispora albinea TaxID=2741071 RepID=A0ABZ2LMH9_9BACT
MKKYALVLDLVERLFVVVLYGALIARIVGAIGAQTVSLGNLLLVPSEGMVLVFVVLRRGSLDVSTRPRDWALATMATAAPMLVTPDPGHSLVSPALAGSIIVWGTLVQLHAKLVLGRSFGCVPANRGLKYSGPYRFVRHPMYAGYALAHLGFALMNASARNVALYAICSGLQLLRLMAEERLLGADVRYRRYCAVVRYRVIPGLF